MSDLINKYPYTDFHAVNLDYILKVVRENAGLHLEVSGNQLLLKTADNTIISAITIPYATEAGSANNANSAAYASSAGSASSASYAATAGSATTAANATNAAHAATADTATSATSATSATNADHADTADLATNATNAVNAQNAAYAESTGSVEHAEKAFEAVANNGDNLVFTLGDGSTVAIKVGVANRAMTDYGGNNIRTTYFASVFDDNGTLRFRDALGNVIASITPSSQTAEEDSYGNTIADYIKTIATAAGSNYVTITHGNGTSETILIPYSESAWKDTNGNVIKNFYAGSMEIVEDAQTGHYNLVVYNGDTPKAELYRFEILAYKAQEAEEADHAAEADHATTADSATVASQTPNGDTIQEYAKAITSNDATYGVQHLITKDGDGNVISNIDLFHRSQIVIGFADQDQSNPNSPYNLAVGASETYLISAADLAKFALSSIWDVLDAGVYLGYVNENDQMIMWSPIYYSNGYYMTSVYDYQGTAFKTFRFTKGSGDYDLIVERFA